MTPYPKENGERYDRDRQDCCRLQTTLGTISLGSKVTHIICVSSHPAWLSAVGLRLTAAHWALHREGNNPKIQICMACHMAQLDILNNRCAASATGSYDNGYVGRISTFSMQINCQPMARREILISWVWFNNLSVLCLATLQNRSKQYRVIWKNCAGPQMQVIWLKLRSKNSIRKVPHFDYLR
jgi:hypothetical protein